MSRGHRSGPQQQGDQQKWLSEMAEKVFRPLQKNNTFLNTCQFKQFASKWAQSWGFHLILRGHHLVCHCTKSNSKPRVSSVSPPKQRVKASLKMAAPLPQRHHQTQLGETRQRGTDWRFTQQNWSSTMGMNAGQAPMSFQQPWVLSILMRSDKLSK